MRKIMFALFALIGINVFAGLPLNNEFITTWSITNEKTITITISDEPGLSTFNYSIDWGDGTIEDNQSGNAVHTYTGNDGTNDYQVKISGTFPGLKIGDNRGTRDFITSIDQWGTIEWETMREAFKACRNLNLLATDKPDLSNVTDLGYMFSGCISLTDNEAMNSIPWDVSTIKNMEGLFSSCEKFNQDLSNWNVIAVENMQELFNGCKVFNQPLNTWKVDNVMNMQAIFANCNLFNQDLDNWNTSKVETLRTAFGSCNSFNGNITTWDVTNVKEEGLRSTFISADVFNQDISGWNVTDKITSLRDTFDGAESFNQDISGWDVSNVTDMSYMFDEAYKFNQDLNTWDTGSLQDARYMFQNTYDFNGDISNWDMTAISTGEDNDGGVDFMFRNAISFNQDISGWELSNCNDYDGFLNGAIAFDQDLSTWDLTNADSMEFIFGVSGISIENYDAILEGWATDSSGIEGDGIDDIPSDIDLGLVSLKYCQGESFRNMLINDYGWNFLGDRLDCTTLSVFENDTKEMKVYPNPVSDVIKVTNISSDINQIAIYSLKGTEVMSVTNDLSLIDVSNLSNGLYVLKLIGESSVQTIKFIKE